MKKFYGVIGNPPYQEQTTGTSDKPIYNYFMDESYSVGLKVELITPARFLFNAGKTPKEWNRKMLSDPCFRVLSYTQASGAVFPNTDIKGGVAISYRDESKVYGAIETFTAFEELNTVFRKVSNDSRFSSFSSIVYTSDAYCFTKAFHSDYPSVKERLSVGHEDDLVTHIIDTASEAFQEERPDESEGYVQIYGRAKGNRGSFYIKAAYIIARVANFEKWKVLLPKSNGSGALGETLSTPLIGQPLIGHTQTFISIGCFETEPEAEACLKYVQTKFARALLGVLKITQHNPSSTWKYVPLQNFTSTSNIDWSKSIPEIDQQLYAKYGLDEKEIAFIESHVKEMS